MLNRMIFPFTFFLIKTDKILYDLSLLYKSNRFHVAVHLFGNRSQKISKCGENIGETFLDFFVLDFFVLSTF